MRYSQMLIPTLKEDPADAQVISHRLMLRSGMIKKVAAGIYSYLPLGLRVIQKVSEIVREEMNRVGGQEMLMPMTQPAELWEKSGRWSEYGSELLRLKDRKQANFCLGPTHEEVVTELISDHVKSYRQLPQTIYQIQTKFRDETRPRFGLMRSREFIMKDAYSFDLDRKSALRSYEKMHQAYCRIFERCGLRFRSVEADTGNIGGNRSHEFQVLADTGEDLIASCEHCGYAANIELASIFVSSDVSHPKESLPCEKVLTPSIKTCSEIADFLGVSIEKTVKAVLFMADDKVVLALCRGDHDVNETKLKKALHANWARLMTDEETHLLVGPTGFLGPVGLNPEIRIVVDQDLSRMPSLITGANQEDYHLAHVVCNRDFPAEFFDLHSAMPGDICGQCRAYPFVFHRGIEVGHIFYLSTKYSERMHAYYLDEKGEEITIEMGCYGIGIGRTAAAAIEQNHDRKGIVWPLALAPFQVSLVRLGQDEEAVKIADQIYRMLLENSVEVLYDDRDERPGVKFADHDLIGCPVRVTVGGRSLKEGLIEVKRRSSDDVSRVAIDEVISYITDQLALIRV
jgi:prolyl-tRNA synthetase